MRPKWRGVAALLAVLAGWTDGLAAQTFDHGPWNDIVARYVVDDGVRYGALQSARTGLDAYVEQLAGVDSTVFDAWPRADRVAYLINAYNALVVLQVVDEYPLRRNLINPRGWVKPANSVWQVRGFFDGIRHRVAGRDLTLDDIEHVWLRDRLAEPRVHFALVCAAASCPPFRTEAYTADRLDEQLDDQAARFFNDPAKNAFLRNAERVRLSSILLWFGADFTGFAPESGFRGSDAERGSLAFAARFLPDPVVEWLRTGGYTIEYLEYDWTLNDASGRAGGR